MELVVSKVGIEPTTRWASTNRSTIELHQLVLLAGVKGIEPLPGQFWRLCGRHDLTPMVFFSVTVGAQNFTFIYFF